MDATRTNPDDQRESIDAKHAAGQCDRATLMGWVMGKLSEKEDEWQRQATAAAIAEAPQGGWLWSVAEHAGGTIERS